MQAVDVLVMLLGALAGGFVNGLTGFGTALAAIPIWLHVMPPALAGQLAAAAAVVSQAQTLPAIWHAIDWRRVAPFIVAGLLGVPIGVWLLPHVGIRSFKLGIGTLLVGYCLFFLLVTSRGAIVPRASVPEDASVADAAVGFCSGVLGGLAGLSGVLPTVWATFKPWSKDHRRALFQSFNVTILAAMLIFNALAGQMASGLWLSLLLVLPGTLVGVRLGLMMYRRLDDRRFDRLVLAVLLVSGLSLIAGNL
jgi:uncharacterized membrane protein YfcA